MAKLDEVRFLKSDVVERLGELGLTSTYDLLAMGSSYEGRRSIAQCCETDPDQVTTWLHTCDLLRIKGLGEEYADLMWAAGTASLAELSRRDPAQLRARMALVNAEHSLVGILPSQDLVNDWIVQAGELPPKLVE